MGPGGIGVGKRRYARMWATACSTVRQIHDQSTSSSLPTGRIRSTAHRGPRDKGGVNGALITCTPVVCGVSVVVVR